MAAPEHLKGCYTPAIDIFGLGAVAFQLTSQNFRGHVACDKSFVNLAWVRHTHCVDSLCI